MHRPLLVMAGLLFLLLLLQLQLESIASFSYRPLLDQRARRPRPPPSQRQRSSDGQTVSVVAARKPAPILIPLQQNVTVSSHPTTTTTKGESDSAPQSVSSHHFFSRKTINDPSFFLPSQEEFFQKLCIRAGIHRPSKIQALAWPVLLKGTTAILADQTGSGKTLAYLLPLLQRLMLSSSNTTASTSKVNGTPRILILAPVSELADQIKAVCDRLNSHDEKNVVDYFSTMVVTATGYGGATNNIREQIRCLQRRPMDVLISTPGRMATILRTRQAGLDLSQVQAVVLDEVDVLLLDPTFAPQLRTIGAALSANTTTTTTTLSTTTATTTTTTTTRQFVFCTATLPNSVEELIATEFGTRTTMGMVEKIRGPGLHRVALTVHERLIDVSVPSKDNRNAALCFDIKVKQLLQALRQTRCRRTLIFCNTVESCRQVENLLNRQDRQGRIYQIRAFHNAMTPQARQASMTAFCKSSDQVDSVLICTDRAARGVDFGARPVDHTILFDFPKDPAEYVRRVGRTARAGRKGTSTIFAYGWQLPIARQCMGAKIIIDASSTVVAVNDDDENEDVDNNFEEFRGGANRRRKNNKVMGGKDEIIKENIEGGALWGGRTAASGGDDALQIKELRYGKSSMSRRVKKPHS